ncbi:MAG: hypothetical protein ACLFUS_14405 [Candidatus Sumerlaeia bacterium]
MHFYKTLSLCISLILSLILVLPTQAQEKTDMTELLDKHWEFAYTRIEKEIETWGKHDTTDHRLIWNSDRGPVDVILRRTRAMMEDLRTMPGAPDFKIEEEQLDTLQAWSKDKPDNLSLFKAVCALRREIAMQNPLLDFESIIFTGNGSIEMFHSAQMGSYHFTDPGASIYMVTGYKQNKMQIKDMLEHAKVVSGRYKGDTLSNKNPKWEGRAAYQTPSLSFDGKEMMFAWCPKGWGKDHPKSQYPNVFRNFAMNLDGSNLRMINDHDGEFDDYDPTYLPDGRRLFVSDRHNGGQRCGWMALSGNMYSVDNDGSNLVRLTWHETNERHPSVCEDGKIAYSRWDYIDRHAYSAQSFWLMNPDGTDPRSYHGNYEEDDKPFHPISECYVRPIPGTPSKFVAIETGHHQAYKGNLVVIDISKRAKYQEQIRFFYPDMQMMGDKGSFKEEDRFKDGNKRKRMFTSPTPLSEDYVIACEFSEMLLVDKFRNEVLLFDSENLFSHRIRTPIPVKARPVPPIIPLKTFQGKRAADAPKATIGIMDVYESDFEWPENTNITHIRICQILARPKWPWDTPRNVYLGWSDGTLIKHIIGTVPVEADGSAYFEAPIEREIYFQAVDDTGMAVQSMLSGTYVHRGEQLTCVGCHEDKWVAPKLKGTPIAFQREPSKITPEVDGTYPLTYPRLAKPVFEKNCKPCHEKEGKGISFEYWNTTKEPGKKWVGDLENYIRYYHAAYGGYKDDDNNGLFLGDPGPKGAGFSRSIAGEIGARGSELLKYLGPQHHGSDIKPDPRHKNIKLSYEDFHRITLWLDLNAQELGTYDFSDEAKAKQRAGEVVWPEWPGGTGMDPDNPTGVQQPLEK